MPIKRRAVLTGAAAAPVGSAYGGARIVMNDASRLNPTPVMKHWQPGVDQTGEWIAELRSELRDAARDGRRVAVGAARHSMGGQSLPRDGLAITLEEPWFEPDTANGVYRVSAGARWSEIIGWLDPIGFSPKVMQSNNDFGVASTFSVNAHGWPVPYGPFGSTVRSIRMMLADGSVVECSRTHEPELFSLAMGGYGLFGVILNLDIEMTLNVLLRARAVRMPAEQFAERFIAAIERDPSVRMAYGRMSVARASFFSEAIMTTYHPEPVQPAELPWAVSGGSMTSISNMVYRQQIGSETYKRLRWVAEAKLAPGVSSGLATRNSLMNEPVSNLANTDRRRTDILHEYFVPPDRFGDFLLACREVIPPARAEFINVTLRYIGAGDIASMSFAPGPRIAAVMSFSQEITTEGEIDMLQTTEALIDRILAIGGAFYLPYRLHARRDQVTRAYPKTAAFIERKRFYDPGLLFRNAMWDAYFA